jgi:hypothetical protein
MDRVSKKIQKQAKKEEKLAHKDCSIQLPSIFV